MAENEGVCAVREIEHTWIEMPDGVRLSARLWLPDGPPAPAILEYIPYRKRDLVRARDERNHPFFAAHGYACLRVDMRGSGDSEGVMPDMYADEELADARHVIEWIAAQDWCNGRVGMFGTSWGGTASLQAAVDAPGPLKAVIANCATADRFEDDIHWMGGNVLTDTLEWAATLPAILAAPPDAATVGEGWFAQWKARLEALSFPHETWLRQAKRDPYWRRGSVRFQADRLGCPVLAAGGWADRYSNSIMPLMRARPDICWGIVGPWGHHYPDVGEPGPGMSFQDVALEWWDHWLKRDAAPDWPRLRLWRREFDAPQDRLPRREGEWIAVEHEHSGQGRAVGLSLGGDGLSERPQAGALLPVPFDLQHGECAGDTGYFGRLGGLPLDQAPDDARALCFETAPLETAATLIGSAELVLDLVCEELPAQLACRICDVAPDGRSNLVTRTVRNLALDDALDGALDGALDAGRVGPRRYRITFPTTAYRFAAGHRIRLALGGSYWPMVWPFGGDAGLRVATEGCALTLPGAAEAPAPRLPDAVDLPAKKSWTVSADGPLERRVAEVSDGWLRSGWTQPPVSVSYDALGLTITTATRADFSAPLQEPDRVRCEMAHSIAIARPDGTAEVESRVVLAGTDRGTRSASEIVVLWEGEELLRRSHAFDI